MLAFIITGCASTGEKTANNDDGYRCEKVYSTGSRIPKKYCSTKKQRDELEKQSKELIHDIRRKTNAEVSK